MADGDSIAVRWLAVLLLIMGSGCGPNAARVTSDVQVGAAATPTLAKWLPVSTPTAGPPLAPTATAIGLPPQAMPTPPRLALGRPTLDRPPSFSRPGTPAPAQCRFGDGPVQVSVPVAYSSAADTPGAVPTYYQGSPGLVTVAVGEALPGVQLELRLPETSFVAGAVVNGEIRVRNNTSAGAGVLSAVGIVDENGQAVEPDAGRTIENGAFHSGPARNNCRGPRTSWSTLRLAARACGQWHHVRWSSGDRRQHVGGVLVTESGEPVGTA